VSVFLQDTVTTDAAHALARRIDDWDEVGDVQLITPEQALEEFGERSGLGIALEALDENPLPAVLIITPANDQLTPAAATDLRTRLARLPETALAQLDLEWVQRLTAMLEIAQRGILVISTLLALAVLLVIGNTIRLEIQNRRDEIVVAKLIGATNGFVRRPFLYSGIWYGLLGAAIAWLLVETGFWLLAGPVARLAGLYQSSFSLETLPLQLLGLLIAGGLSLGLLGSWLAVGRHLRAIEPS
jgi:cell division transport system permease protein